MSKDYTPYNSDPHVSVYGLKAELAQTSQNPFFTQGELHLSKDGRQVQHIEKTNLDGPVSFDGIHIAVERFYNSDLNSYITSSSATIENLDIFEGVITVGRLVACMAMISPKDCRRHGPSFTITGSLVENLKVAGTSVDVRFDDNIFNRLLQCSELNTTHKNGAATECLTSDYPSNMRDREQASHSRTGVIDICTTKDTRQVNEPYRRSALTHLDFCRESELENHGSFIFLPKFGTVRVAGIEIQENLCKLTMLKVHPISDAKITVSAGETGGGNTGSGGGPGYPG